jgi:5'-3' exonuclease
MRYGPDGVLARLGVQPQQVADYLALCGDAADNIPGVPGIGAKTAVALLGHFGSLEQLLARIDEVPTLRMRGAAACAAQLRAHAEQARLYRSLTRIEMEAPGAADTQALQRGPTEPGALDALCGQLRLSPMLRSRLEALRR